MIDGTESNLIVKDRLEDLKAICKESKEIRLGTEALCDIIERVEARRRDRIENTLFKRFIRWVRNDRK